MDDMGVPVEGIIRGEHSTAPVHRVGAAVAPVHLPTAFAAAASNPESCSNSAARSNGCAPPIVGNVKPLTPVR